MTDISALQAFNNWKLLRGGHRFPGPDGGTCINEAAIVASGMAYRQVSGQGSLPTCFSKVLGGALISLNDGWDDVARQKLMRYVLKLSGSADVQAVEDRRAAFLFVEVLRALGPAFMPKHAHAFRSARYVIDLLSIEVRPSDYHTYMAGGIRSRFITLFLGARDRLQMVPYANFDNAGLELYAAEFASHADEVPGGVDEVIRVLDEAFAIGKQAPALGAASVRENVSKVRREMKRKTDARDAKAAKMQAAWNKAQSAFIAEHPAVFAPTSDFNVWAKNIGNATLPGSAVYPSKIAAGMMPVYKAVYPTTLASYDASATISLEDIMTIKKELVGWTV